MYRYTTIEIYTTHYYALHNTYTYIAHSMPSLGVWAVYYFTFTHFPFWVPM